MTGFVSTGAFATGGPAPDAASPVTLFPALFTNAQTFYAPTVTGVSPGAQVLQPARFDNAQTFYAPTVARGAVTVSPALFGNAQTFYAPTVTGFSPGAQVLQPARFDNAQTFYAPSVTTGGTTVRPALFVNFNTFFTATIPSGAEVGGVVTPRMAISAAGEVFRLVLDGNTPIAAIRRNGAYLPLTIRQGSEGVALTAAGELLQLI